MYITSTIAICALFYCTCLFQLSLRVLTSRFSDKGQAAVLDRWLIFHLWNQDYISGASHLLIILNFCWSNAEVCQRIIQVPQIHCTSLPLSSFNSLRVANGRTWESKIRTSCKSVVMFRIIPLHCMNNLDYCIV